MDPSWKSLCHAAAAAGALLAAFSVSHPAFAGPATCESLTAPITYAIGGSGPVPFLGAVASAVTTASGGTLVYSSSLGGCAGVNAFVGPTPTTVSGSVTYWDATTGTKGATCTVSAINGEPADFGVPGTYANYCPGVASLPAGVGDLLGPVQAYDFLVPYNSPQTSISAQAAYFVFGFGASSPNAYSVSPWTVPNDIITRNDLSAAAIIIALGVGVPIATLSAVSATGFTDGKSNGGTITDLNAFNSVPANAAAGLGFATAEVAEAAAANEITVLAYQHTGQSCGWLPNSTSTAHDKINVRSGLYALWANIHFIAAVDANGVPTDANAKQWIGYFTDATTPPAGVDPDALVVQAGAILDCAMEVQRTSDLGPLEPYAPAAPCDCFFDFNATGSTTCQSCTTDANCPVNATHCRKGYCEVN
jgi:hypothetical protein